MKRRKAMLPANFWRAGVGPGLWEKRIKCAFVAQSQRCGHLSCLSQSGLLIVGFANNRVPIMKLSYNAAFLLDEQG